MGELIGVIDMIDMIDMLLDTIFANYALTKLFIACSFLTVMTALWYVCKWLDPNHPK